MEIKFEKIDNVYVAEFEITSNCNIHIEREGLGMFTIASRGSKSGKYVPMENGHYGDKYVIDVDMLGEIYPKYIKVTSVTEPTYVEVNMKSEGGGGNSGDEFSVNNPNSEYYIEYFKWSDIPSQYKNYLSMFVIFTKYIGTDIFDKGYNIVPSISAYDTDNVEAIAMMPYKKFYNGGDVAIFVEYAEKLGALEFYKSVPRMTEEEFYNIPTTE